MKHAIRLDNISAGYGDTPVLSKIDLTIPEEQITVILGQSGCGKSTLLKTMLRLIEPLSGSISMLGRTILSLDERDWEDLLKHIGVLFQNGALLNSLSLYENVVLPLEQHTELPDTILFEIVHRQLARVGLGAELYKMPGELSGGMQKRAALARAMILNPDILFCDEPSAGLDPVTANSLDELLLSLKKLHRMTIVVVTHELASIRNIADHIIFLHDGSAVFTGSLDRIDDPSTPSVVKSFFNVNRQE